VLNWIWLGLFLFSIAWAALFPGRMGNLSGALLDSANAAVQLIIGLVGGMVFFLGLTRVAFDGGLRDWFARVLAPVTRRIFPEVPPDHPAMGAMIMNMASNMMGLGNAATPFGLKAMGELARLNPHPGSASNAMVLFLAINTSAITLFPPFGTIMVREAAQSADPWAIWIPTLIATSCSTLAAMTAYFLLGRLPVFRHRALEAEPGVDEQPLAGDAVSDDEAGALEAAIAESPPRPPVGALRWSIIAAFVLAIVWGAGAEISRQHALGVGFAGTFKVLAEQWLLPIFVGGLLLIGLAGRVRVYDSMIEGAKEGLEVAVRIVPYLVAILAAVAIFRASGALDWLPMAFLRPLSGSGAFGVMSETLLAHGPDSFIGYLTCTLMGSTETTFYVLALYLGAAGVVDGRHALAACLIGDLGGFIGAVAACHWFFG